MAMDYRQLQIFHSVVTEGSFTRAAERLFMAQPAVSIAVRKLEEEFDTSLLNRSDRKISLTAEGRTLFRHAERILAQFQQARMEMSELQGLEGGEVRLGTSAMFGSYFLPKKITGFRERYPNIRFEVYGEGTRRAQQLLLDGAIELGVVNMENLPEELEGHSLVEEEVVACLRKDHPKARKKRINFPDFAQEPLIVYGKGYYLREIIEQLCKTHQVNPMIAVETNLLRLMTNLIQGGQGIGFCLKRVADMEPNLRGVAFKTPIFLNLGIAWKRNHYLSKANRAFVDFLLEK